MLNKLKKWLAYKQKIALAKQILASIDIKSGLTSDNRQKLMTFLELTAEVGFSEETRACSSSLSSIIGHLDDRPLVVTRNLVSELLKDSDRDD